MNILFHLIPKEKVAYINENSTLRQAMEKMEFHRYTAVPIISDEGKYVGVLREGDILWYIKNLQKFDIALAEKVIVSILPRKKDHRFVSINADMEELVELSVNQNFIPVVDDLNNFIGIITRKSIIMYLADCKKGEKK
ncbi:MAG: CBS domain-containing protein [Acholeplasma sp.]|nr:CBS domain-containing protein [Acholeplasma sp.]